MDGQYFGAHDEPSDPVEDTVKDTNSPVLQSDFFADRVPVDSALIHETPMGGTVAAIPPLNEPVPDEIAFFETPDQEIPMGGTLAAVGPMDETIAQESPAAGAINREAPYRNEFQTTSDTA